MAQKFVYVYVSGNQIVTSPATVNLDATRHDEVVWIPQGNVEMRVLFGPDTPFGQNIYNLSEYVSPSGAANSSGQVNDGVVLFDDPEDGSQDSRLFKYDVRFTTDNPELSLSIDPHVRVRRRHPLNLALPEGEAAAEAAMEDCCPPLKPPRGRDTQQREVSVVVKDGRVILSEDPITLSLDGREEIVWRCKQGELEIRFNPANSPFAGVRYLAAPGGGIFSGLPRPAALQKSFNYTIMVTSKEGYFVSQTPKVQVVRSKTKPTQPPRAAKTPTKKAGKSK